MYREKSGKMNLQFFSNILNYFTNFLHNYDFLNNIMPS